MEADPSVGAVPEIRMSLPEGRTMPVLASHEQAPNILAGSLVLPCVVRVSMAAVCVGALTSQPRPLDRGRENTHSSEHACWCLCSFRKRQL